MVSVFIAGTASTANTGIEKAEVYIQKDCTAEFRVCNNHAPSDYKHFNECMEDNGR